MGKKLKFLTALCLLAQTFLFSSFSAFADKEAAGGSASAAPAAQGMPSLQTALWVILIPVIFVFVIFKKKDDKK